jgi:hypothetical protein
MNILGNAIFNFKKNQKPFLKGWWIVPPNSNASLKWEQWKNKELGHVP